MAFILEARKITNIRMQERDNYRMIEVSLHMRRDSGVNGNKWVITEHKEIDTYFDGRHRGFSRYSR